MSTPRACCWCHQPFVQYSAGQEVFWGCPTPACFARQQQWALAITHGKAKTATPVYLPLPRQVEALEAVMGGHYKWILYGGARGGAKSHFLRWLGYMCCLRFPHFQAVLLRRTYPELEKSHMRRVPREAALLHADPVLSAKPPIVRFANGSVLEFGHCQDEGAVENYLSAEYNLVLPDEVGTFTEDMIMRIGSSARLYHPDFKPCVVCATNPGARWVYDRWIAKVVDQERYENYDPLEYCFIQSLLDDNPYPDPEYERFLNSLDPNTRAAWRYGRWDCFEGQYFSEFKIDEHVRRLSNIPPTTPRIAGMDWGFASPGVFLRAVPLPDGHLHIEREFKFKQTVAEEVALTIQRINREEGITHCQTYADPSMWIHAGQTGESIAETIQRTGVPLYKAKHERLNGWQRVRHWLRQSPDGTPWLTIDPDCAYLIRSLPTLVFDEKNPEDLDTTGEDHAADALRYLLMSRPAPLTAPAPVPPPPESAGALFQEACQAAQSHGILGIHNVRARW